mmetsp:Transcript_1119/g.3104  ORF Transcript_1119/g.3104 Transcript_1119/m.3104 type:complete len:283 (+) Transcript_1119:140-988(+)
MAHTSRWGAARPQDVPPTSAVAEATEDRRTNLTVAPWRWQGANSWLRQTTPTRRHTRSATVQLEGCAPGNDVTFQLHVRGGLRLGSRIGRPSLPADRPVRLPLPCARDPLGVRVDTNAVSLSHRPLPLVPSSVLPGKGSLPLLFVCLVLSAVLAAVWPCHDRVAMKHSLLELAIILTAIVPRQHANAVLQVVSEVPVIGVTFGSKASHALLQPAHQLAVIPDFSFRFGLCSRCARGRRRSCLLSGNRGWCVWRALVWSRRGPVIAPSGLEKVTNRRYNMLLL